MRESPLVNSFVCGRFRINRYHEYWNLFISTEGKYKAPTNMHRDRRRKRKSNVLDEANVWQRIQARLTDLPLPWTVYCPIKAATRISLIANSM
jgi:hypothetical protein